MIGLSTVYSTYKDAAKRLIIQILYRGKITDGKGDMRTPIEASPYGIDTNPIKGKKALYARTDVDGKYYTIGYLNTNRLAETGEVRLFSTDANGELKFYAWLRSDGTLSLGGENNNAVKFNELKTEFNKLKADHNDLVAKFNAHTHPYVNVVTAATTSATLTPASPNTSNIDNAKNVKIKTL